MMKKPEDGSFDKFDPDNIAPTVVWLGSEQSSNCTGRVFELEGGKISLADGWRSTSGININERWQPEKVGEAVAQLLDSEPAPQKVYGS